MIEELIKQGLNRKEAEVYLILIRYGTSTAGNLCKKVHINRTLVYALLESIVQKGFAEKIIHNNKKVFIPNDPQLILQRAKQQMDQATFLVKDLENIRLINSQPIIRSFQGIEGIRQMTDIFLEYAKTSKDNMLQIGQEVRLAEKYPELIEYFISKRLSYKIPLKLLCNKSPIFDQFLNENRTKKELREIKFVDEKDLSVDCTTYICGDFMAIMSLANEMQGYILQSKNVANLNRQMFYLLWERV